MQYTKFEELLGQTLTAVTVGSRNDTIEFTLANGDKYKLYHDQSCCENVSIEDIAGDLQDLVGSPLTQAEEATSGETPKDIKQDYTPESQTWTFYKLATIKGSVTIRFHGSSNGYYSELVDFGKVGGHGRW